MTKQTHIITAEQQKLLKILRTAMIIAVVPNIILVGFAVFGHALSTSSNGGPLFYALAFYSVALPFIATFAMNISLKSHKGVLPKRHLLTITIIGMSLALAPVLLFGPSLVLAYYGLQVPVGLMIYSYLSVYPLGGAILLVNSFLALPALDDKTKQR